MRRMISEKAQKYIKDLATNHPDPSAEWGGSGVEYTAGNGIDITEGEISVNYGTGLTVDDETLIIDTNAIATKTDLEDYELKADAFSGDYNDLTNKPTLATVATTGDYDDLLNKPSIPAAQVQSNWNESDTTSKAYIQNKPTIPDAVSGTNDGTNWTSLTIGNDTYGLASGGSVDIDNKTIIENLDGELETAVGGWTETHSTEEYSFTLPTNDGEWNTDNSTIADTLYNLLEPSTRFDIEIKVYNGDTEVTPTYAITEAYIYSDIKEDGWFNDNSRNDGITVKCSNGETYQWKFYIRPSTSKRVNIWQYQTVPGIRTYNTTSIFIKVKQKTTSIIHKIKSQYLPDEVLTNNILGNSLYIDSSKKLNVKLSSSNRSPMTMGVDGTGIYAELKYDNGIFAMDGYYLSTQIGGGYKSSLLIDKTKVSNTSDYWNVGYISQSDIVMSVAKIIINCIKNTTLPTPGTSTNATFYSEISIRTSSETNNRNIYVNYTIDTTDNNIVTVTKQNTSNTISIDDFTFRLDTEEITLSPNKVYINYWDASHILGSAIDPLFDFNHPEKVKTIEQIDKKFIPLVSDIPNVDTTTDGTYVLKATVSSGVVTYAWVLEV